MRNPVSTRGRILARRSIKNVVCSAFRPSRERRRTRLVVEELENRVVPALVHTLQSFGSPLGIYPASGLIADSSGNLFGTTNSGGSSGYGTVFELVKSGSSYSSVALYSFTGGADGANPYADLMLDSSGNLFGTTNSGGSLGNGTVFELVKSGSSYAESTLASFDYNTNGANPYSSLIADSSGNLFGTTNSGGSSGYGTVFELVKSGSSYSLTTLVSFDYSTKGAAPQGGLTADSSGNLYGTTNYGGPLGNGTVFKLTKSGSSYSFTTLYNFNYSPDGGYPIGNLLVDSSGNLFGTTSSGGSSGYGTVFELTKSGSSYTFTTFVSFDYSTNGASPQAGLTADSTGNLYGTTNYGGPSGFGTVFKLTKSGSGFSFSTVYNFNYATDGGYPLSDIFVDSSGNLFATTNSGGSSGYGTVFELAKSGSSYSPSTIISFGFPNGANPSSGLLTDSSGDLFGTTTSGGNGNNGLVFELTKSGNTYTYSILHSFTAAEGTTPYSGLIADSSGNLFGTTLYGGSSGYGTVYELVKSGSTYTLTTLYSFNYSSGAYPYGTLFADSSGNLFGTTYQGGTYGYGTAYELVKSGSSYTLTTLVSFNYSSTGAYPQAGLIADSSGNLFGTTYYGGAYGNGTAYELVKSGSSYTLNTLFSFNYSTTGGYPTGNLTVDGSGNLFGTTNYGGPSGYGTVFELVKSGSSYILSTLVSFNYTNGGYPHAGLVSDSSGNLFGITNYGGASGSGTVFELVKSGSSYSFTTILSLNPSTDGSYPQGSLIVDGSGNLFGTTNSGGPSGAGTVFEVSFFNITTQPQSTTIDASQVYNLSVAVAKGSTPYTYQWYTGTSGDTSNPIAGATSSIYAASPGTTTKYWVRIGDNTGVTLDSTTATITVNPAPTITPLTAPIADVGRPYSLVITVANGTQPYTTFQVTGFNAGGTGLSAPIVNPVTQTITLSGTPSAAGTVTFTVTVTDSANFTLVKTYTILVNPAPTFGPLAPTQWTLNQPGYTGVIPILNGSGSFVITSQQNLPPGLTAIVSGNSLIFIGTPTSSGTYSNVQIAIQDSQGGTGNGVFSITVNVPPVIVSSLPAGTVQTPYQQSVTTGGSLPIGIAIISGSLPPGLSFGANGVLQGVPTLTGNYFFTVQVTDAAGVVVTQNLSIRIQLRTPSSSVIVTGADSGGGPQVNVFDAATHQLLTAFYAFAPSFTGGVRVAVGDVNGDGVADIIVGAGPGGGPQVTVYDGRTFQLIRSFFALPPTFRGGLFVASGDVNGDGFSDIIVSADAGGGPQVTAYSGLDGTILTSFYAMPPSFTGGVRVAAGDVNGDGRADVIVGAGRGGLSQVTAYDALSGLALQSFLAFGSFTGGVWVAAGDLNGDGFADIVVGAGKGGPPQVNVYDGARPAAMLTSINANIGSLTSMTSPLSDGRVSGVRVATTLIGSHADLLTVPGAPLPSLVDRLDGISFAELDNFYAYPPDFRGGIFIAG